MVFGLFNKEKAFNKLVDRATNSVSQSADRWAALEKLREDGRDDALFAICRRFSFSYDKTIEDQQEKDWAVATLVALGEGALGPLRRYMKGAKSLGYPLKILEKITSEATILQVIDELLEDEEPGYVRDPKKRIDIIEWLGTWSGKPADIVKRVLPYVEDFDENVRMKSLETIALKPDAIAAEVLCRAMINKAEESGRFKVRCSELLAINGWSIESHKSEIEAVLPEIGAFRISGNTLVK